MPAKALKRDGYAHYLSSVALNHLEEDLTTLRSEFSRLERDEFAPAGTRRFRRYGNGVILPWQSDCKMHWLPVIRDERGTPRAGYDQGNNNPDHPTIRQFHALSDTVKRSALLGSLIREDFSHTFWEWRGQPFPIYVGVHFIKLTSAHPDEPGISSPDCFHQDGEPFTFAHLIHRSNNAAGGVNYIGNVAIRNIALEEAPPEEIRARFTLQRPFESFAVHDPRVTHYVSPLVKRDRRRPESCERSMILIDFSTTTQCLSPCSR